MPQFGCRKAVIRRQQDGNLAELAQFSGIINHCDNLAREMSVLGQHEKNIQDAPSKLSILASHFIVSVSFKATVTPVEAFLQ